MDHRGGVLARYADDARVLSGRHVSGVAFHGDNTGSWIDLGHGVSVPLEPGWIISYRGSAHFCPSREWRMTRDGHILSLTPKKATAMFGKLTRLDYDLRSVFVDEIVKRRKSLVLRSIEL